MHVPGEAGPGTGHAVAIVGAALRFPGASDPSSFFELTVAGRRMFRDRAALLDDGSVAQVSDTELPRGITARHALAAETAADALADVPDAGRDVAPERIGVFIAEIPEPGAADVRDWVRRRLGLLTGGHAAGKASPGSRKGALAGRNGGQKPAGASVHDLIFGTIGLMGRRHPASVNGTESDGTNLRSTTLKAAGRDGAEAGVAGRDGFHCSLRAVTAACEALNSGEFDLVLAGGVTKGAGAPAGERAVPAAGPDVEQVRVYDASPTGTLPGEGCGFVALVRAADARAAEVPCYAEIVGWHAAGPAASQQPELTAAYLRAGVDPADIQYVEGHGAATAADDLAELTALLEVLGSRATDPGCRCALGSVSANIGDTRAAAGVAALLKAAFAMTADVIPPSTGCVRPNRLLRGDAVPFRFLDCPEQWPQTPVQFAAVNTLGTAPHPDAPRSGAVHVMLRRDRDPARRPGRRRKPVVLPAAAAGASAASEPG
ncbi:MAG TPA: polyketide synthase [Trebonia sp.]|nr:polyketide synthase [Trebonia sp.]